MTLTANCRNAFAITRAKSRNNASGILPASHREPAEFDYVDSPFASLDLSYPTVRNAKFRGQIALR
jgi:hypothetical protein